MGHGIFFLAIFLLLLGFAAALTHYPLQTLAVLGIISVLILFRRAR